MLKDPEKRKKYDRLGANWKQYENAGFQGYNQYRNGGQRTHFEGDFGDFFGKAGSGFSDFFDMFFGGRSKNGFGFGGAKARARKGNDVKATLKISLDDAYYGATKTIGYNGNNLRIKLKPGTYDGQKLRLKGKGEAGANGAENGDLYLEIQILSHPVFERKGNDLYAETPLDVFTALLGGTMKVQTFKGEKQIKVPEETDNGKVFRLKGLGMPVSNSEGSFGDLYAKVKLSIPKNLTKKEKEALRDVAKKISGDKSGSRNVNEMKN